MESSKTSPISFPCFLTWRWWGSVSSGRLEEAAMTSLPFSFCPGKGRQGFGWGRKEILKSPEFRRLRDVALRFNSFNINNPNKQENSYFWWQWLMNTAPGSLAVTRLLFSTHLSGLSRWADCWSVLLSYEEAMSSLSNKKQNNPFCILETFPCFCALLFSKHLNLVTFSTSPPSLHIQLLYFSYPHLASFVAGQAYTLFLIN